MSPITHLFASWLVAVKTTADPRDCRLVALAGLAPDLDGMPIVVDIANRVINHTEGFPLYFKYHHWYGHGIFAAVLISAALAYFARDRWRVFGLAFLVFHLHLLCDLLGSRGPGPDDVWPIVYLGPFSHRWSFTWSGQWWLEGWQNRLITVALLMPVLWMASTREDSVVGVLNRKADAVFTKTMRKWREKLF